MKHKKRLQCNLKSQDDSKLYENISVITLPTKKGQIQILPSHVNSFIKLEKGTIIFEFHSKEETSYKNYKVDGGVCYIEDNNVLITL